MFAHSVLLFSPETEEVVGLIEQQRWTRSLKSYGKKAKRSQTPYKDKESYKWESASVRVADRLGDVMGKVVSVCDREADIYEYLLYKQSNAQRFVVRSAQNRQISESDKRLFSYSETLKSARQATSQDYAKRREKSQNSDITSPIRPGSVKCTDF